ncbi:hypothetical protein ABRY77_13845 [Enterococcus casseliflavus]|uniref:hypothetical protein n=1 Tax=Enterococcus casseliflavus TaxID=37734 RepID=UPI003EE00930
MSGKSKYLILAIPLLENGLRSSSFWVKSQVIEKDGKLYIDFDWTDEIRETTYFDSKESAEEIANKHCAQLQPNFCSVVMVSNQAIKSLGISRDRTLDNLELYYI